MSTKLEQSLDITATKHGGNSESRSAFQKSKHNAAEQRARVLELITQSGPAGLSMKQVASAMSVQLNTISGRGSELRQSGAVEDTGERRSGSAVLRATGFTGNPAKKDKAQPTTIAEKPETVKPLSPTAAQRELEALEYLYEHSEINTDSYDAARKRVFDALAAFGGVNG